MTPEELAKQLKELGVQEGSWNKTEGKEMELPLVSAYKPLLLEVKKLVEAELSKKVSERAKLQEMLGRLKHGGAL